MASKSLSALPTVCNKFSELPNWWAYIHVVPSKSRKTKLGKSTAGLVAKNYNESIGGQPSGTHLPLPCR